MWLSAAPAGEPLAPDEIRLLTELGFVASGAGKLVEAAAIFNGLKAVRPDRSFVYIGLAVTLLNGGKAAEAAMLLEREGLQACPDDPEIRVFLGLALRLSRRAQESTKVLESVLTAECSPEIRALAQSLLTTPVVV
ncbi:hypothetical protein [Parachitinimonas caeni]|uniref:Tetratricopeptide repeat protein n=1 Tax=Parachitinimonas caeni TaxID=3031301 RepID=A0ABT7DXX2_9NEIS|nr:hypothetical protein [Parachitinimonas caeni]MDK2123492.1 hypothetical protein [Parachitinimonas caeni]